MKCLYKIDERYVLTCQAACPLCKPFQNLAAPDLARFAPAPNYIFDIPLYFIFTFSPILKALSDDIKVIFGFTWSRSSPWARVRHSAGTEETNLESFAKNFRTLSAYFQVDGNFPWDFHWMTHLASATVCLSSWLPAPPPSSSCTWSSLLKLNKNLTI